MSRKIVVASVGAGLLTAYVGASWLCGQLVNGNFDAWHEKSKDQLPPFIRVEQRYTPGIFSSTRQLTFHLEANELRQLWPDKPTVRAGVEHPAVMQPAAWQAAHAEPSPQSMTVTIRNEVLHGPLPGLTGFGLARVSTHLVLSEDTKAKLREVIGDNEPVDIVTRLGFKGGGTSEITSPAFELDHDGEHVSWQGVRGRITFSSNANAVECDAKAPGLSVKGDEVQLSMGELALDCKLDRIVDMLYAGTMRFNAAGMSGRVQDDAGRPRQFSLERIGYRIDIAHAHDYIDMAAKLDMGRLDAPEVTLSDVAYHFTLKHIHAPTYAALARRLQQRRLFAASDPAAMNEMMSAFRELGPALLEHSPELVIDRIAFTLPEGSASLSASAKLVGFTREDMEGMRALAKLQAVAEISVAEALIEKDWSSPQARDVDTDSTTPSRAEALRAQFAQMEQEGFVTRRNGQYESHVEFKQGELTVNGKPLR